MKTISWITTMLFAASAYAQAPMSVIDSPDINSSSQNEEAYQEYYDQDYSDQNYFDQEQNNSEDKSSESNKEPEFTPTQRSGTPGYIGRRPGYPGGRLVRGPGGHIGGP
ncbi:MAG TPA: hypothetical protein VIG33_06070 [Pseudobdellovibrionaceae bacterium]|jgi:hypothetical protein